MITVVTGEPRSGTSLMMRLLKELGVDIAGKPLLKSKKGKRRKQAELLNPKGFYEVPGIVMKGIPKDKLELFDNKAIKLITPALMKTSYPHIGQVIFCLRDPREIAQSQENLTSRVEVAGGDDGWQYSPKAMRRNYKRYANAISRLFMYIKANPNILYKILFVEYTDVMFKTEKTVLDICKHLELNVSDEVMEEAVGIIDPTLYRSRDHEDDDSHYFKMAMFLYKKLQEQDFSEAILDTVKHYLEEEARENVRWLDDDEFGTWVRMGSDLYRPVKTNNKEVRDKLVEGANTKRKLWRPDNCVFYRPIGKEYTIIRPKDIGPLIRKKISCVYHDKDLTREVCNQCWGGLRNKNPMFKQHRNKKII